MILRSLVAPTKGAGGFLSTPINYHLRPIIILSFIHSFMLDILINRLSIMNIMYPAFVPNASYFSHDGGHAIVSWCFGDYGQRCLVVELASRRQATPEASETTFQRSRKTRSSQPYSF